MDLAATLPLPYLIISVASVAVILTALVSYFIFRAKLARQQQQALQHDSEQQAEFQSRATLLQDKLEEKVSQLGKAEAQAERVPPLELQLAELQRRLMEAQLNLSKSNAMQQSLASRFEVERQALNEKVELLEDSEQRLQTQFENLANKIFEDKTAKMRTANSEQLTGILGPFKQQLEGFRQQVNESYAKEQQERFSLKHQLEQLQQLNKQMSEDAVNLTKALKGDNKAQGNWGEVILDRVLSESGLRLGHEYDVQQDLQNDGGKHFKPDVIVHLPDDKDVIIDSKVSLVAYEQYFNADTDEQRIEALKQHIASVRQHIKGLGQKDYQKLHGVRSLDYVLMFVPVEPAFLLALERDPQLVSYALENNIMLVSPTNLLVALRTISNIWRYEYQNQNAQQIAHQAGRIYDKVVNFVEDMEKLGRALETADRSYASAMNKLASGKGNLIRQAHQLHQMGGDKSKNLDPKLLDKALDDSHDVSDDADENEISNVSNLRQN
ncbi:DNA recombination protein RmuC [Shewanella avicenniae]|uniref:DNA recombination protein RmuC n=1 Tax=Shewanella avicenniae TaxID=2814294 RepID=A0ABX7QWN5_9GAMM|nr:DNA recombination protein RmuC [Shewanella avicenniae]QSX35310.1 DNA recombination protein RmuC [Shewanella avicenniae]